MNDINEQETLLSIVETWNISETPEYRGFRCANCQKYKNEAWYHWVHTGNYKLPIHLCLDECELLFRSNLISIDLSRRKTVDRKTFGQAYQYSSKAVTRFKEIIASWPEEKEPELKAFTCDNCEKELDIDPKDKRRKGFHVWWNNNEALTELHFHTSCGEKLGL